jgi:mannose-6-phosphate isomerase-like protein (cupin superfamily)
MPDYTIVNLGDVEDVAPTHGMTGIESRFARTALGMSNGGLSLFRLSPGYKLPFGHRHGEQEEVYVVLSGSARIKLEDEVAELRPLDAVRVPGSVARGIVAGPEGAELLAFGAPNTDNKDAELVAGFWDGSD